MNKQTIITMFFALVAMAVYGQEDTTKVKKKDNTISMYGTVADGFTKATAAASDARQEQRDTTSKSVASQPGISSSLNTRTMKRPLRTSR